jgi:hypothetical protein
VRRVAKPALDARAEQIAKIEREIAEAPQPAGPRTSQIPTVVEGELSIQTVSGVAPDRVPRAQSRWPWALVAAIALLGGFGVVKLVASKTPIVTTPPSTTTTTTVLATTPRTTTAEVPSTIASAPPSATASAAPPPTVVVVRPRNTVVPVTTSVQKPDAGCHIDQVPQNVNGQIIYMPKTVCP